MMKDQSLNAMSALAKTIRGSIEQQIAPAKVTHLNVFEDEDHDGDPILRVEIGFTAPSGLIEGKKAVGVSGVIADVLARIGIQRFPMVTFVGDEEWDAFRRQAG